MYYEEKEIDGKLYCKTSPNGEWEMFTLEQMANKYLSLKEKIRELERKLISNYEKERAEELYNKPYSL